MLRKGAIVPALAEKNQFLSSVFLREKKDRTQRPIINLKSLNQFIPYIHFKMETISNLRDLLEPNDLMIEIDLKDAYFTVPLHESIRKHIRFKWEGTIYEFVCLCFGLGPGPRIFTKFMKIPITILRRLNMRLITTWYPKPTSIPTQLGLGITQVIVRTMFHSTIIHTQMLMQLQLIFLLHHIPWLVRRTQGLVPMQRFIVRNEFHNFNIL